MKIPIIIRVKITESIDEHIADWITAHREDVLRATFEVFDIFLEDAETESIEIIHIHEDGIELDEAETLIAVVTIEREDLWDNLQECEDFFVEIEDYETANRVLEYRKKLFT